MQPHGQSWFVVFDSLPRKDERTLGQLLGYAAGE